MNVIVIRYGELFLKGDNRGYFENTLISNIKRALKGIEYVFQKNRGRYLISDFTEEERILSILKKIFGIHSVSIARKTIADMAAITAEAVRIAPNSGTFKVITNRADKTFPYNSMQINCEVGATVLDARPALSVDVHNPDYSIFIDIREDKVAYVYKDIITCLDGMPVGTAGSGLLMLSGGIDSPVAGFLMSGRGLRLNAIHFHSFPYTSEHARQKVYDIASVMSGYCGDINISVVKFTEIQEELRRKTPESYNVILMRRLMMRVADRIAAVNGDGAIITGESLAQVASQTLQSINATNIATIPVLRPLIGLDKNKIIEFSKTIGTYDLSILPYEDCCTVFVPKHPVIKPDIDYILRLEEKLDIENLIKNAMESMENILIKRYFV